MNKFKVLIIFFLISILLCMLCIDFLHTEKDKSISIQPANIDNFIMKNDQNRHLVLDDNFDTISKGIFLETIDADKKYNFLYNISKKIYFILFGDLDLEENYSFTSQFEKSFELRKKITKNTYLKLAYNTDKGEINFVVTSDNFLIDKQKSIDVYPVHSLKNITQNPILKIGENKININNYQNDFFISLDNLLKNPINSYHMNKNNLLNNIVSSFENGLWQEEAGNCSNKLNGDPEISLEKSSDTSNGKIAIKLSSKNHYACTSKTFSVQMDEDKLYQLSFDYKNIIGKDVQYYYKLRNEENNKILGYAFTETIHAKDNEWHTFSTIINPKTVKENFVHPEYIEEEKDGFNADLFLDEGISDFYSGNPIEDIKYIDIFFYAPSDGSKEITNLYDNVRLAEYELTETRKVNLESIIDTDIILAENILLQQGENKFEYLTDNTNLLDAKIASFESGLWQADAGDCSNSKPGEPEIDLKESSDTSNGETAIKLSSKNHYACTSKSFPVNLSDGKLYKLQFDYKNIKGGKAMYYYNLRSDEKQNVHSETIQTKDNKWHTYETIIDPEISGIKYIDIYFYAPSDGKEEIINLYDNVRLTEYLPKDINSYYLHAEQEVDETPKLKSVEYKAINRWKNKVVLHGVNDSFLLVYPEKYSENWKVYPTKSKVESQKSLENYFVPEIESNRQATKEEVNGFISDGLISTTGNKFISKNFDRSIRNDNLSDGKFYDSWFREPIPEDIHFQVNNYSNSWWIDIEDLCNNKKICKLNEDGTFDISLVIENKYNRWFYLGLLISGTTFAGCIGYLGYDFIKRRRRKRNKLESEKVLNS